MQTKFLALAAALTLTAAVPAFAKGAGGAHGVSAVNSLPKNYYSNSYTRGQDWAQSGSSVRQTMAAKHPQYGAIRKEDDNSTQ